MAVELGRRLLAEVQEVGLDEILQTVRFQHDPEPAYFGIPTLDQIVNSASAKKTTTNTHSSPGPPILELIPQAPGSGTTHFLYLLTTSAILPASLGGKDSCVAIIDTDNTFSVSRLVQQLRIAIRSRNQDQHGANEQHPATNPHPEAEADASEKSTINSALRHVHIFRPQSQTSLLATLDSLPTYFFQPNNPSTNRPLAFIALDSLPVFHWQQRAEIEAKEFEELETQPDHPQPPNPTSETPARSLPQILHTLSQTFPTTPQIYTNPSHYPRLSSLLQASNQLPLRTISLTFARKSTRPFPPMIGLSEALREKGQREIAVRKAGWWVGSSISADGGGSMGFEIGISREKGIWVVES